MKLFTRLQAVHNQIIAFSAASMVVVLLSFVYDSDDQKREMVVFTTPYGDMTALLYDETPLHKANFLKLVGENYLDSTLFHRVIKGFMIQGGDPESKGAAAHVQLGKGGPGYTIPAEFNSKFIHKKGALAAARQGDAVNPEKASSGSQFYIVQGAPVSTDQLEKVTDMRKRKNPTLDSVYSSAQINTYEMLGGTPHLDGEYTVFGEIVDGLDIIDSIAAQPTARNNRPLKDIPISVKIIKKRWPYNSKK